MAIGRQLALQVVHTLRATIRFSDGASGVLTVGTLPVGALVIGGNVSVLTAFNAGTNNNITVGTAGVPASYQPATAMATIGHKAFTGLATSADLMNATAEVPVIATLGLTGTAATTGVAIVVVSYVVNNDK